jgi:hypothetical protein
VTLTTYLYLQSFPSVYLHDFGRDMLLAKVTRLIGIGFGNQLHWLAVSASVLHLKGAGLEPENAD